MTPKDLMAAIKRRGGVLTLDGDGRIKYQLPEDATHMLGLLSDNKPEVIELLKENGGRVATFPHCPQCGSYGLYRRDNLGNYECMTCELQDIREVVARRGDI
jgi:hypothetical protein